MHETECRWECSDDLKFMALNTQKEQLLQHPPFGSCKMTEIVPHKKIP